MHHFDSISDVLPLIIIRLGLQDAIRFSAVYKKARESLDSVVTNAECARQLAIHTTGNLDTCLKNAANEALAGIVSICLAVRNGTSDNGRVHALEIAVRRGAVEIVKKLSVHISVLGRRDALMQAAADGRVDIVTELLRLPLYGNSALDWAFQHAAANDHVPVMNILLLRGVSREVALEQAAANGRVSFIKDILLPLGVSQEGRDMALKAASGRGQVDVIKELLLLPMDITPGGLDMALAEAAANSQFAAIGQLLPMGFSQEGRDMALEAAAAHGHVDIVKMMLPGSSTEARVFALKAAASGLSRNTKHYSSRCKGRVVIIQMLIWSEPGGYRCCAGGCGRRSARQPHRRDAADGEQPGGSGQCARGCGYI